MMDDRLATSTGTEVQKETEDEESVDRWSCNFIVLPSFVPGGRHILISFDACFLGECTATDEGLKSKRGCR